MITTKSRFRANFAMAIAFAAVPHIALSSPTPQSSKADMSKSAVTELAQLSQDSHKSVISTLSDAPKSDLRYLEKTTKETKVSSVANLLHARSYETSDSILIYHLVPQWFPLVAAHQEKSFSNLLSSLLYGLTPAIINDWKQNDKISVGRMSKSQKDICLQMLTNYFVGAPAGLQQAEQKDVQSRLQNGDSFIRIWFRPVVYVYTGNDWAGRLIQGEKTVFKPASTLWPKNVETMAWYKPPALIRPNVALKEKDKNLRVKLRASVFLVKDLVNEINAQTKLSIQTDARLDKVKLFISPGERTLENLLSDVCAVAGIELKTVDNRYFLGLSSARKMVSEEVSEIEQMGDDQQSALKAVNPSIQTPAFLNKITPFSVERYLSTVPVEAETLTQKEKDFVARTLDGRFALHDVKLCFVISAAIELGSDASDRSTQTSSYLSGVSEDLVQFPLEAPLKQPVYH